MKIALGVLIGIFIVFSLFWGYRHIINPHYSLSVPAFITDTSKKRFVQEDFISLKNQFLTLEEKIASTNKRLDDILIFGGIIITLVLGINVAVFVNSDHQVEKYFKDNFDIHKNKVLKYTSEAEECAGKMKSELELIQKLRTQTLNTAIQPPSI